MLVWLTSLVNVMFTRGRRDLYLQHLDVIRDTENVGSRLLDRFNLTLNDITPSTFPEMVRQIFANQTTAFKIKMLRIVETGKEIYYYSSRNNRRFYWRPTLDQKRRWPGQILDELSRRDMLEFIGQRRPDNKWVVHLLTNITIYPNKLN